MMAQEKKLSGVALRKDLVQIAETGKVVLRR
jgi:hypothetical protein